MPTFSSVVHKPGRRAAVPKAVPRRNAQRPGSATASVTSTPAPTPHPAPNSVAEKPLKNLPPDTLQTAGQITRLIPNSKQQDSSVRQTRRETALGSRIQESATAPPIILSIQSAASESSQTGGVADDNTQFAAISSTQRIPSESRDERQQHRRKRAPELVAGRKRKAAELGATSSSPVSNVVLPNVQGVENAAVQHLSTEIHSKANETSPDIPLPSVEGGSTTISKPKRHHPKPRGPRRSKAIEASHPTSAAAPSALPPTTHEIRQNSNTQKGTSRPESAAQTDADTLLQNVTSQFSAVSRLADGIDGNSRAAIRPRSRATPQAPSQTTSNLANALHRVVHQQSQARSADELASEIVNEAIGGAAAEKQKRKRRKLTPEDAEEHVIDPSETRMGDLTRDTGLGKKSGLELQMQNVDWKAVKEQRKQLAAETEKKKEAERAEKQPGKARKKKSVAEPAEALVPEMTVVNGIIQVVNESREINIRQEAEAEAARQDVEVLTIDRITSRRNQNTIGKPKGLLGRHSQWTEEMDERFYKGIRMFGADMLMVASLFPGLERRHIKKKFVREERTNPQRLREALFNRLQVDADAYQEETGLELGDPQKLDEELKAMEADLRRRFEEQMAEQHAGTHEAVVDDADIPIPSREPDDTQTGTPARSRRPEGGDTRFDAVADDIVNRALGLRPQAVAKKAKKRAAAAAAAAVATGPVAAGRKKKDGSVAAPRKGSKAAKQAAALQQLGGTVEEIGTVDEIPR